MPVNARRSKHALGRPWEPSARQLEVYAAYTGGGATYKEVAGKFGLSPAGVHKTVRRVNDWLAPRWVASAKRIKAEHAERLMGQYREAMRAWERSLRPLVVRREGESGGKAVLTVETREQAGDPRFLAEARAALREVRELWGADKPPAPEPPYQVRVAGRTPEQIRAEVIDRLDRFVENASR